MIDDITPIIDISVQLGPNEFHTMKLLAAWFSRAKLVFEMTHANLEVLMKKPFNAARASDRPQLAKGVVKYLPKRKSVQCKYRCASTLKWKFRTIKLKSAMDLDRAVTECKQFYEQHHHALPKDLQAGREHESDQSDQDGEQSEGEQEDD